MALFGDWQKGRGRTRAPEILEPEIAPLTTEDQRPGGFGTRPCNEPMVAETPAGYARNIPRTILGHLKTGAEYSRAEIIAATGITKADWTWAVRQLKAEGARYRLKK